MTTQATTPITSYQPALYAEFEGIASTGENYKRPRAYAVHLKNAELTKDSKITKARGYQQLGNDNWNDNRIREILQYRNSGGDDILLCFGSDQASTSGGIASVSSQWTSSLAFNETLTLSDFDTDPTLLQVGNLAYLFNGTDDKFYDGSTWESIGTDAPLAAAVLDTTVNGSMNQSSDYKVSWRWYDSTYGRRSNISPISTVMTTGSTTSSDGLRITLPGETPPTGYDKIEVLCTLAWGSQFVIDQNVSAATTSVDITQSDYVRSQLPLYEGIVDSKPSQFFDFAVEAEGVIYGGATDDEKCRMLYTRRSSEYGSMPQSWPAKHFVDCDSSASDLLVGAGYCGAQENPTIIVHKQKTYGKLVSVGSQRFIFQKLGDIGCAGHKSIFKVGEFSGWYDGESNCYVTDGNTHYKIGGGEDGEAITQTFKDFSKDYKQRFYACHVQKDKQIRLFCVRSGQNWSDKVLMGHYADYQSRGIVKWTTREPGPDRLTHPGVKGACAKVVLDTDNAEKVLFGNSDGNGKLYEWDYGSADDTLGIYAEWEFRPEHFNDLRNEKLFTDVVVRCRTGSASTDVHFYQKENLSGSASLLSSFTLAGSGFVFGTSRFGVDSFSSAPVFHEIVPMQLRAYESSFVVRQTDTSTFELLDFTMMGMP